jgi:amino acid adenylation domain-containing protein
VPFVREAIEQPIHGRFEQQVDRHPDRLAVRSATLSLNYRQLDQLANRMAHGILARRGSESEPVGLLFPQGAPLIAAILGVLKAGKLYVPIDPADPPARIAHTLDDAGAALLLTERADSAELASLAGRERVVVSLDELVDGQPGHSPALPLRPDAPAYIYYTSGSTGRPKGVFDLHRNVLHNIMRYTNSLRISAEDRLTLLQSPGFSGAVSSMFSALLNGAAVFPYDVRKQGMARHLADWLIREQLTMYHSVPMVFRSFLNGGVRLPAIRVIRLEGDAASKTDVALYREHFGPECLLVNGLGTTETGIVRQFFMSPATPLPDGVVPIGYATEDMHAMLLDEAGREVGENVVGELAIRSKYLAAGYWKQPELTRGAFLPDADGERSYRTGDLGLRHPDGCLEYLGRKHSGPKIRGQRVEPAEVERALLSLEAVQDAAAVIREDTPGDPRLVAYLVPAGSASVTGATLRGRLAELLPAHLIPSRFVVLERLPLSANGKVDRKALPAPGAVRALLGTEFVAPSGVLEQQLATLWQEVLETEPIGATDNFFELGGDSLRAAALLTALEEMTGWFLLPTTVIEAPTIKELASVLRGDRAASNAVLVRMQGGGAAPPCFFCAQHGGGIGACVPLSRRLGPAQPFYGLQSVGLGGEQQPLASIEAIAAHFLEVIQGVQAQGPYHLGGLCFGAVIAFEMAQQLVARGEAVGSLFIADITPEDFPALLPAAILRQFRRRQRKALVRSEWREVRRRRFRHSLPDLIRAAARQAKELGRIAVTRLWVVLGWPLPERLRDIAVVNKIAFARYTPRSYPGRLTLILRAEDAQYYASDPRLDWQGLAAGGLEIHYVPGANGTMWAEPRVQMVAEHLRAAMLGSDQSVRGEDRAAGR